MNDAEYFAAVKAAIYPDFYSKEILATETEFLLKDGSYLFYCLPAASIDYSD